MPNLDYPDDAPTYRVLEVREIRATSPEEAWDIAQRDLDGWRELDTGEVGHTAGGRVVRILAVDQEVV